jgi:hypothetical protein
MPGSQPELPTLTVSILPIVRIPNRELKAAMPARDENDGADVRVKLEGPRMRKATFHGA